MRREERKGREGEEKREEEGIEVKGRRRSEEG